MLKKWTTCINRAPPPQTKSVQIMPKLKASASLFLGLSIIHFAELSVTVLVLHYTSYVMGRQVELYTKRAWWEFVSLSVTLTFCRYWPTELAMKISAKIKDIHSLRKSIIYEVSLLYNKNKHQLDVSKELTFTTACHGRGLNHRLYGLWAITLSLSYPALLDMYWLICNRHWLIVLKNIW